VIRQTIAWILGVGVVFFVLGFLAGAITTELSYPPAVIDVQLPTKAN